VKEVSTASEKVKKGVWLGKSTKKWLQTAKRNYEKYEGDWDKEIDLDPMEFEDKSYDRYELRSLIHLTKLNSASCQEIFLPGVAKELDGLESHRKKSIGITGSLHALTFWTTRSAL